MESHSTDDVDYKKFRPHGRVTFSVIDDNLVIYKAFGPFNLELLKALEEIEPDVLQAMKSNSGEWAEIVIFEHSCFALDDFMSEFREYLLSLDDSNILPKACAYVIGKGVEGGSIMTRKYQECYEGTRVIFNVFSNENDAITWAKDLLA